MASSDSSIDAGRFSKAAAWMHRNFLWLLVASYLLAGVAPGPGLAIRRLSLTSQVTAPMLLLALLLFCAAVVVRWSQVRDLMQRPGILLLGLIAVWIVPGLFVSGLSLVLPQILKAQATAGMMVGLALVAAMPVANSSVAWCQNARGNVAIGLGLIILTIVLSPVAAPQMLRWMGLALSDLETAQCEQLVARFTGTFFIVWVILPSLAGMAVNRLAGSARIVRARPWIRIVSAITLLVLNYANASLAMPKVFDDEGPGTLLVSALLAIALSALGIASASVMARLLRLPRTSWISLVFGFSMKHTGLALVLAGEVLQTEPRVILMIVLATLLQHIVAGVADWYLVRNVHRSHSEQAPTAEFIED